MSKRFSALKVNEKLSFSLRESSWQNLLTKKKIERLFVTLFEAGLAGDHPLRSGVSEHADVVPRRHAQHSQAAAEVVRQAVGLLVRHPPVVAQL